MKVTKKELNSYLKQIKKLLVCNNAKKKEFMKSFKDNLEEYLKSNPDADFKKIQEDMGTPQEIANAFLENESAESIKKRISIAMWFKNGIIIALFMFGFLLVSIFVDLYKSNRGYIEETITVESIHEDNIQEEIIVEEIIEGEN